MTTHRQPPPRPGPTWPAGPSTVWPPGRQGLAAAAGAVALATSGGAAVYADGPVTTLAAVAHLLAAAWALVDRRALTTQVAAGTAMAWALLVDADGTVVGVVAVVVGVVATSELLAAAGRLGIVIGRDPGPEVRRVGGAVALAAAASGLTLAAGVLPGPAGLVATAVAVGGCLLLAAALRSGQR